MSATRPEQCLSSLLAKLAAYRRVSTRFIFVYALDVTECSFSSDLRCIHRSRTTQAREYSLPPVQLVRHAPLDESWH